jgi:hypothetical protein
MLLNLETPICSAALVWVNAVHWGYNDHTKAFPGMHGCAIVSQPTEYCNVVST